MNIIQGYKFQALMDDDIAYRDTDKVDDSVYDYKVLITHNSDHSTSMANFDIERNKNIIWFSTNVDIEHERIIPIPIGLENPWWHPSLQKIDNILKIEQMQAEKMFLCSAAFNTNTHPSRVEVYNYFKNKPWCKIRNSINGQYFMEYLITLACSKFAICPRGNGIDTHRLWECLYAGTIPIVEDCINVRPFAKILPIIVVKSFEEVTQELLEELWKIGGCGMPLLKHMYWDKLDMNHWIRKIKNVI